MFYRLVQFLAARRRHVVRNTNWRIFGLPGSRSPLYLLSYVWCSTDLSTPIDWQNDGGGATVGGRISFRKLAAYCQQRRDCVLSGVSVDVLWYQVFVK